MTPPQPHSSRQASVQQALEQHQRWLTTVLRARGVDAPAVEEQLQEVATAAMKNASQLRDLEKIAPWLYRIAVLTALQYRRRQGRRRKLVERYAATQNETLSSEPDPLAWLLADEQQQLIRQAIATLPPKDAEILLLKHTENWSYRQLALHLGTTASAIDSRLHRARAKMRTALTKLAPSLVPEN